MFIKKKNYKLLDKSIEDDTLLKNKWKFALVIGGFGGVIAFFISALKKH